MSYLKMLIRQQPPSTVDELLSGASAYVEWVTDNPLLEDCAGLSKGFVVRYDMKKARAMTYKAFAGFIGTSEKELQKLRGQPEFEVAFDMIDQVFYAQKFEHAAAGLLNAAIIARDLGLADKQELTGRNGGPLQVEQTNHEVNTFLSKVQGMMADDGEPPA